MEFFPDHERCFAHTLQLVIKDGMQQATRCTNAIAKASSIVNHVRKSTVATEILEDYKMLQTAVPTRWNSQLMMVRSVLAIPKEKLDAIGHTKLSPNEREVLSEFVDIISQVRIILMILRYTMKWNSVTSQPTYKAKYKF